MVLQESIHYKRRPGVKCSYLEERMMRSAGKNCPLTILRMSPTKISVHFNICQLPSRSTVHRQEQHDQHEARHDQHEATHDQHEATHDQHEATHDQHEATHDQHEATHDQHEARHDQHEATHDQHEATHDQHEAPVQIISYQ